MRLRKKRHLQKMRKPGRRLFREELEQTDDLLDIFPEEEP